MLDSFFVSLIGNLSNSHRTKSYIYDIILIIDAKWGRRRMPDFGEEKAFSLVEVIVAMALLLVIFIVSTQIIMNTITQSNTIDEDFTTMEIADGVLKAYQSKSLEDLDDHKGKGEIPVNIPDLLELPAGKKVEQYEGHVLVTDPDETSLTNYLTKIVVTVSANNKETQLEGYVER
ncbi:prepilin-type N-terminal cleavage/methylation domain-containing protein [Halobacillus trueperi]|uniref:Prepilin-type N-terminal cleavage/methylation domain-containing protein n=2 Tax=Bacillaceae TaxID=186817 RepID=A0A3D8V9H0_9BACI|nr:prepilin-type N-terminal cleavage/methylation domain-containing protein [Halobacillus trueperi]